MFFKHNPFNSRLTPSNPTAYAPAGLQKAANEPSPLTFDSKKTKTPVEASYLGVKEGRAAGQPIGLSGPIKEATTQALLSKATLKPLGHVPRDPGYLTVMNNQRVMTKIDHLLVWQKRGPRDLYAYYLSIGLCAIGVGFCLKNIYAMSFPKKE